ncbi:MAG: GerMN domain-containing protein, partial [Gaiellaceae bacterium]
PPPPPPPPPPPTQTTPTTTSGGPEVAVRVYLLRRERVAAARRLVPQVRAVGSEAIRELLDSPTQAEREAGLTTAIPVGTELRGLDISGGVATVDLSRTFESGGGSLSMTARVAQVVYTLTQFPTVRAVRFSLDGEPVEHIGGEGVVVDPPVGRADFEDQTPTILVESPTPGETISSPVRIRGTANTFEATFVVRLLLNAAGARAFEQVVTATSGSGTRGTFDVSVPYTVSASGPGTLVAFEPSAVDGSPVHVVEIPVYVTP